jgi:hypothetical protein
MLLTNTLAATAYKNDTDILSNISMEGYGTINKFLSGWIYSVKTMLTDSMFGNHLVLAQNKPIDVRFVTTNYPKGTDYNLISGVLINTAKNQSVTFNTYYDVLVNQLHEYMPIAKTMFDDVIGYLETVNSDTTQGETVFVPRLKLPKVEKFKRDLADCFDPKKKHIDEAPLRDFSPTEKVFIVSYNSVNELFKAGTEIDLQAIKDKELILLKNLDIYLELIDTSHINKTKQGTGELVKRLEEIRNVQEYLAILFERVNGAIAVWNTNMILLNNALKEN